MKVMKGDSSFVLLKNTHSLSPLGEKEKERGRRRGGRREETNDGDDGAQEDLLFVGLEDLGVWSKVFHGEGDSKGLERGRKEERGGKGGKEGREGEGGKRGRCVSLSLLLRCFGFCFLFLPNPKTKHRHNPPNPPLLSPSFPFFP